MILDSLENLKLYANVHPLFEQVIAFLSSRDLATLEVGKTVLVENELIINVAQTNPKSEKEAKLETHKQYIDIQIPLTGVEVMGYTPASRCLPVDAVYNSEKDITFFGGLAEAYFPVNPGQFAIFFPQDGHAPGISTTGLKKVIVKILVH